ncbi:MAG: hypothetical protein KTR35_16825 [Gammaproteobacteria bacterium]|nr:hypothetical protein [Gammaproteobacteria bacterium]
MNTIGQGIRVLCCCLYAVLQLYVTHSSASTDVPVPDEVQVYLIADPIRQNGHSYRIWKIDSEQPSEWILEFYRKLWSSPLELENGFIEPALSGWKAIAHLQEDSQIVVQVQDNDHGATGLISQMEFNSVKVDDDQVSLALSDVFITRSVTRSVEHQIQSTTRIYESNLSVADAETQVREALERLGWELAASYPESGASVLMFARVADRIEIVVSKAYSGSTAIVINHMERYL